MKGKIISNFDIKIYSLDGKLLKAFYNMNESDAQHLYAYYVIDEQVTVDVTPSETLYDLLAIKEDRRKR